MIVFIYLSLTSETHLFNSKVISSILFETVSALEKNVTLLLYYITRPADIL